MGVWRFVDVRGRPCREFRGVSRISFGLGGGDVPDVDDSVLGVEPRMLVNLFFGRLASWGALLAGAVRFRAPADYNLGAAELDAFEQRLEPGFELVVEIIHEDDPGFGDALAVGQGWLEQFGVAGGARQRNKIYTSARHICPHFAEH